MGTYTNPIITATGEASPVNIFQTVNWNPQDGTVHPIATRAFLPDGRVFYWGRMYSATAIGPNKLAQAAAPIANHTTQTGTLTGTTVVTGVDASTTITATLGATAGIEAQYQGGFLNIESATTGAGQQWRIGYHAWVASSGVLTFSTNDPVQVATSGTTTWSLKENPWAGLIINPATTVTGIAAGVVNTSWAAAATATVATPGYIQTAVTPTYSQPNYGWIQTWGQCSVLADTANNVVGTAIQGAAAATAGAVTLNTGVIGQIGWAEQTISTDNIYLQAFLTIAP